MTRNYKKGQKTRTLNIETLQKRLLLDAGGLTTPLFHGPTPYLSENDLPAGFITVADCEDCVYGLETFEDGDIDFGLEFSSGVILDPDFGTGTTNLTDSVDGDDGVIDGTGQTGDGGYSFYEESDSITITLPSLMQSAGLVWTDGDPFLQDVVFEAFDENGNSLGVINGGPIADGSIMGTTADDHFFGVTYGDGITTGVTAIRITNTFGDGIEIDHVQFANCSACCDIDLELTKSVDATIVDAGDVVTWTIEITNNPETANAAATGVQVTDLIPTGLTIAGVSSTGGSFSQGVWTLLSPLEPGETETITITTIVDSGLANGTVLKNIAEVTAADQRDVDSTPGNDDGDQSEDDEANAMVMLEGAIDLEVTKDVDLSVVSSGDTVTWTVAITNNPENATVDATGVTVTDLLPGGLTLVNATPSGNGIFAGDTWTLVDPLAPGATATLTLETSINDGLANGSTLVNTAYVETANEVDVDSNPGNTDLSEDDADDAAVTISNVIDLELSKEADAAFVDSGDTVTWTVSLANNADNATVAATGVTVTDVLPGGLTILSVTPSGNGIWSGDTWTLVDPLAPGDTETLTFVTSVNAGLTGGSMLVNAAFVSTANEVDIDSSPGDTDLAEDDADDAKITINSQIDLELTKEVNASLVETGDTVLWTITLTNNADNANTDATGVVVQDVLPDGVSFVSATPSGNSQFDNDLWIINDPVAPGESLTLVIETTVNDDQSGQIITNVAEVVDADQADVDSAPNNDDGDQSEDDEDNAQISISDPAASLMLSGHSYIDTNDDGIFQESELPLLGVEIMLSGTDVLGNPVDSSTFTDVNGFYKFNDLTQGNYTLMQVQPVQFVDGQDTVGNLGGDDSVNDKLTVNLTDNGTDYNFGELGLLPEFVNKRLYLTSTPYDQWEYIDVQQSSIWYSFDVDHQSFLELAASLPEDGNATVTVYDANMNEVSNEVLGLIVEPIQLADAGTYYLQISGDSIIQTLSMDVVTPDVSVNGNQLIAVGTDGDDNIFFHLGSAHHILDINGMSYVFDAAVVTDIHIGASSGLDSVTIIGTHLDEVSSVIGTSGQLSSSQYDVHTYQFDNTTFVSGGGNDYGSLYGSNQDDVLHAFPDDSTLTTPDNTLRMLGYDRVDAFGRGGYDYGSLYGTNGVDHFYSSEAYTTIKGDNYRAYTKGFERIDGFGRGGNDIADLIDSAGNDVYVSTDTYASMRTDSRFAYTKGFETVNAQAIHGGYDLAHAFHMTLGDDEVDINDGTAQISRGQRTENIAAFDLLYAILDSNLFMEIDLNQ